MDIVIGASAKPNSESMCSMVKNKKPFLWDWRVGMVQITTNKRQNYIATNWRIDDNAPKMHVKVASGVILGARGETCPRSAQCAKRGAPIGHLMSLQFIMYKP